MTDTAPTADYTEQRRSSSVDGMLPEPGLTLVSALPTPERRVNDIEIVRATQQEEILLIKDIALEFHAESRYAHLPFSEPKFSRFFSKAISDPENTLALYVRCRDRTVAVLNAGVGDYYLGEGGRMATVYVMYVSAGIRGSLLGGRIGVRLLRMASEWARSESALELHIHSTSGIDAARTDKMLRRIGFKTYGGNYAATLA
ncbi:MAG: hypothetical protein ABI216_01135 [Devosia sp.]